MTYHLICRSATAVCLITRWSERRKCLNVSYPDQLFPLLKKGKATSTDFEIDHEANVSTRKVYIQEIPLDALSEMINNLGGVKANPCLGILTEDGMLPAINFFGEMPCWDFDYNQVIGISVHWNLEVVDQEGNRISDEEVCLINQIYGTIYGKAMCRYQEIDIAAKNHPTGFLEATESMFALDPVSFEVEKTDYLAKYHQSKCQLS